ncbi:thymidylate kinase [Aliiruegeria haliotis]|uniref:Thymidylate kinase n=1 Tax=Aliiruegeria haliotis TaxID=1280846 RepID=A0A2T0RVW9_9RHOB|nr:hypothetical protein [Aliiruegeria haliotis]PRY25203.1 thymidylate kinase [Aliiruegeria haliotis]
MNKIDESPMAEVSQPESGSKHDPTRALIAALNRRQVRYCHWKSNIRLPETMSGDEDLDVLVSRLDAEPFLAALSEVGFKLADSRYGAGHPGVIHAFRPDATCSKLLHVHAYFQVISGDSLVKSFRLPFEDLLLDGDHVDHGLPVPARDAELVTFLLRIVLKHTSLAECLLVNRHYDAVPDELSWLLDQCDEDAGRALWIARVPGTTDAEFDDILEAVADPSAVLRRIRLGLRLSWRLRDWRRLGPISGFASRMWRLGLLVVCRIRRRRPRRLIAGGAIVALVGPKASGKSTLGKALASRIGKQIDLRRIHVGKPPATLLSAPFRLLLPLLRRVMSAERSSEYQRPERRAEQRYSLAYVARMTLLAYDRRALLLRSRRAASSGAIIVADRYPSTGTGVIDSSQFSEAAVEACESKLKRFLMHHERKLYADLPAPDLVIRLNAPIETTIHRDATRDKADAPDPDSLRRRREIETVAEFPGTPVLEISTDCPLEQSAAGVVRGVWKHL